MAFCTNCGKNNPDSSKFCSSCGTPINGEVVTEVPAVGMRTEAELLDFFRNTLKFPEILIKSYKKPIAMMVETLRPNEVIEFAACGALNMGITSAAGDRIGFAATNRRIILAYYVDATRMLNNALKGRRGNEGIQSIPYDQIYGVSVKKKLLVGTVTIECSDSYLPISLDKPFVDPVYRGLKDAIDNHCK